MPSVASPTQKYGATLSAAVEFLNAYPGVGPTCAGSKPSAAGNRPDGLDENTWPDHSGRPPSTPPPPPARKKKTVVFSSPITIPGCSGARPEPHALSVKPILKPAREISPSTPEEEVSFGDLLEVSRLRLNDPNADDEAKRQAYQILHRRLFPFTAYLNQSEEGEYPEKEPVNVVMALVRQAIPTLSSCFQRDVEELLVPSTNNSMPMAAMRAMLALLRTPVFSEEFTQSFYEGLLVTVIAILNREATLPKALAKSIVLVLDCFGYRAQVIPNKQYRPLLDAMRRLRSVRSNGIIGVKMAIYCGLAVDKPDLMASTARLWLDEVFEAFLSSVMDVRTRAIKVGEVLGKGSTNPDAADALVNLMHGRAGRSTNGAALFSEMSRMLKSQSPDVRRDVPRIWTSLILLLRNGGWIGDNDTFRPFLAVLQSCLNSRDGEIKILSLIAINALVFCVMPSEKTERSTRKLLLTPMIDRVVSPPPSNGKRTWQAALLAYTNLLYYAFRPSQSDVGVDLFWDEYIALPMGRISEWERQQVDFLARIIANLMFSDDSGSPAWLDNRAVADLSVEGMSCLPEELPALKPEWIRQRLDKVLSVAGILVTAESIWLLCDADPESEEEEELDGLLEENSAVSLWTQLVKGVYAAGSREVLSTSASDKAYARLVEFQDVLWGTYVSEADNVLLSAFLKMLTTLIKTWKALRFVSYGQHGAPIIRFIRHLAGMRRMSPRVEEKAAELVRNCLAEVVGQMHRDLYLACLRNLMECIIGMAWSNPERRRMMTLVVVGCLKEGISSERSWKGSLVGEKISHLDPLVSLLRMAALEISGEDLRAVYMDCRETVRIAYGDGAVVFAFIDPLCKEIVEAEARESGEIASLVLTVEAEQHIDLSSYNRARTHLKFVKERSDDPYELIYSTVNSAVERCSAEQDTETVNLLTASVSQFIKARKRGIMELKDSLKTMLSLDADLWDSICNAFEVGYGAAALPTVLVREMEKVFLIAIDSGDDAAARFVRMWEICFSGEREKLIDWSGMDQLKTAVAGAVRRFSTLGLNVSDKSAMEADQDAADTEGTLPGSANGTPFRKSNFLNLSPAHFSAIVSSPAKMRFRRASETDECGADTETENETAGEQDGVDIQLRLSPTPTPTVPFAPVLDKLLVGAADVDQDGDSEMIDIPSSPPEMPLSATVADVDRNQAQKPSNGDDAEPKLVVDVRLTTPSRSVQSSPVTTPTSAKQTKTTPKRAAKAKGRAKIAKIAENEESDSDTPLVTPRRSRRRSSQGPKPRVGSDTDKGSTGKSDTETAPATEEDVLAKSDEENAGTTEPEKKEDDSKTSQPDTVKGKRGRKRGRSSSPPADEPASQSSLPAPKTKKARLDGDSDVEMELPSITLDASALELTPTPAAGSKLKKLGFTGMIPSSPLPVPFRRSGRLNKGSSLSSEIGVDNDTDADQDTDGKSETGGGGEEASSPRTPVSKDASGLLVSPTPGLNRVKPGIMGRLTVAVPRFNGSGSESDQPAKDDDHDKDGKDGSGPATKGEKENMRLRRSRRQLALNAKKAGVEEEEASSPMVTLSLGETPTAAAGEVQPAGGFVDRLRMLLGQHDLGDLGADADVVAEMMRQWMGAEKGKATEEGGEEEKPQEEDADASKTTPKKRGRPKRHSLPVTPKKEAEETGRAQRKAPRRAARKSVA